MEAGGISYILEHLPVLSALVLLPLLAALAIFCLPCFSPARDFSGDRSRRFSLAVTLTVFLLSLGMLWGFNPQDSGVQFVEKAAWIPAFGVSYSLGVDGISIFLLLLSALLMPLVVLSSGSIQKNVRAYLGCMLLLETAMLGTLAALDVFLFYVFWELMLAPMYFIIGIWGGRRKIYATMKFVLYTVAGSLLMLVSIFYVVWSFYEQQGVLTFSLDELLSATHLTRSEELWLFAAFALAFAIKIPLFPLVGGGDFYNLKDNLRHLFLPALTLGLLMTAYITRMSRSSILNVLGEDYVRTAHAKGVAEKRVLYKHVLRNALIPVVALGGLYAVVLIGSSVMVEIVFSRPGLGTLMVGAIKQRDYTTLQSVMVVYTVIVVLINLLTDLIYGIIDPRIKYQ